jgi:hypothetical protein
MQTGEVLRVLQDTYFGNLVHMKLCNTKLAKNSLSVSIDQLLSEIYNLNRTSYMEDMSLPGSICDLITTLIMLLKHLQKFSKGNIHHNLRNNNVFRHNNPQQIPLNLGFH